MNNILVIGAGYVGFSLAVVLARVAFVTVIDIREDVVTSINKGKSPILDLGIDNHLQKALINKRLKAELFSCPSVKEADAIIVALPTNFKPSCGSFDTSALDSMIEKISSIDPQIPLIIKSTVPVGYTERIAQKYELADCFYSPEFLREGRAIHDNLHPSRIIVGSSSPAAKEFACMLARASHQLDTKIIHTENRTAEVTKLASNSYLAARVAFFNELDSLALKLGLNAKQLIDGVSLDPRIGDGYNNPSFGFGGYCLPKDVQQFQSSMTEYGINAPLVQSIFASNRQRVEEIVNYVKNSGFSNIGVYRAQMKQGSDNAREAISLILLEEISKIPHLNVHLYEPEIILPAYLQKFLTDDLSNFAEWSDLILANRYAVELEPYGRKVLTRDIYNEN